MKGLNGKIRSQIESKNYFTDLLKYFNKDSFNVKDDLVFVTYQPDTLTLTFDEVAEHTREMYGKFKYIEVIEQTFKVSKRYNTAGYIDGYHSHIIMLKSDYLLVSDKYNSLDIKAKRVYYMDGLIEYLSKQAGVNPNQPLPMRNIPMPENQQVEPKSEKIALKPVIVTRVIHYFKKVFELTKTYDYCNKNNTYNRFIDDS